MKPSPSTIARPHRLRSRAISFWERTASPTAKVAQFRAWHRRARHRRRVGAGAGEIRLGQVHAGAVPQACHRAGARRLRRRRRHRRHAVGHVSPDVALAEPGKSVLPRRRHAAARRRPAGADRSRGDAFGDCRSGAARILRGTGRRKAGDSRQRGRRNHDDGRSEIVSGRDPRAGARQLSRLRHRFDAAALLRRHGAAGDAEHPRRISDVRHEAGLRAFAASS